MQRSDVLLIRRSPVSWTSLEPAWRAAAIEREASKAPTALLGERQTAVNGPT